MSLFLHILKDLGIGLAIVCVIGACAIAYILWMVAAMWGGGRAR